MSNTKTDTRLQMALDYAAKGWPVFPVNNAKLPAIKDWEHNATTDAAKIREWYDTLMIGGCNFGFTPGRAGIVVVDIDCNKRDKNGNEISGAKEWANFQSVHGKCDTGYRVATPSGGVHLYFAAANLRSKNGFLPAVDVKSNGGYVVVPGSRNEKGEYRLLAEAEPAQMPAHFIREYGHQKTAASELIAKAQINYLPRLTVDSPDKIEAASRVIDGWREAEEGERNEQLYQMMRELCKTGVSSTKARELYIAQGIDKIGLDADSYEVLATIKSAYGDLSDMGVNSAEIRGADVMLFDELPPLQEQEKRYTDGGGVDWADLLEREVPPRRWFIENWLSADEGYTVLFSGRGGTGKSSLMLDLMLSLATGADFLGKKVLRGSRTLYVSCEDSEEELARRVQSRKKGAVPRGVMRVWPRVGMNNVLVAPGKNGLLQEAPFMRELRDRGREFFGTAGGVLILDTLADLFAGNENDRAQVSQFVKLYLNRLGRELGVTIIVLAHPAKGPSKAGQGFSGSTAWDGAFRCRWELNYANDGGRGGLLELELAKSNATRAGEKIALDNRQGGFIVVDKARIDEGLREEVLRQIAEAHQAKRPYGVSQRSKRPVQTMEVLDLIGEDLLSGAAITEITNDLLRQGRIERYVLHGYTGLRPVKDGGHEGDLSE